MAKEDISDKELDAMIDASIKQEEPDSKPKPAKKEVTAREKKPKAEKGAKETSMEDARTEHKESGRSTPASKEQKLKEQKPKSEKPKKEAALKPVEGYDPWKVLEYPHLTEKSMNLVERNNVLVFIVSMKATKRQVKEAIEKGFGARVVSVRLHITRKNQKKAYVRLAEGVLASDIATRLGMI